MAKVIVFGNVPPPYGGVSVHVRDLLGKLQLEGIELIHVTRLPHINENTYPQIKWPTLPRYLNHLEFIRGVSRPFGTGILHLHENPAFFAPLVALHVMRGGKAIITVHDQMLALRLSKSLPHERISFKLISKSTNVRWIAVSINVQRILEEFGIPSQRITVIPAYIAQAAEREKHHLQPDLVCFIAKHKPTVIIYGYERIFLKGRDLYGFDYAIRVLDELVKNAPQAGLIIFCPRASISDNAWQSMIDNIEKKGLASHVQLLFDTLEDTRSLWKACSVMLRPTLSDGDSVAVREMLSLGLPVIASDVSPRPEGTIVIPLDSPEVWARAVLNILANRITRHPSPTEDNYKDIRALLQSF